MKRMGHLHSMLRWQAAALFLGVTAFCISLQAAPYVIGPGNKRIEGQSVQVANDGSILLKTASGTLTFPKGTMVYVDRPESYDAALKMIQNREWDRAVTTLQKIIQDYRLLQWDNRAKALLARVYSEKGESEKAIAAYDEVFKAVPSLLEEDDVRQGYLEALFKAKASDKLLPMLEKTINNASRDLAAKAYVMRARLHEQRGDLTQALYDYVILSELFRDMPDLQPEALFKAGEILEKLGDSKSAEFYSRLVKEYPDSSYAGQARTKTATSEN